MKILVACERSGRVRDALIARGHDAMSCDIEATDVDGPHHQGDVLPLLRMRWDMVIAFPPCTHLSVAQSGKLHAQKFKDGRVQQGLDLVYDCYGANAPRVAVENPQGVISTVWRRPDQYIEPWWFGDPFTKKTGLWLRGLPLLRPEVATKPDTQRWVSTGRGRGGHPVGPARSQTFPGIANAMAEQWAGIAQAEERAA